MCWNIPVTLTFSLIYFLTSIFYVVKRPRYWIGYVMFNTFYMIMELFQALQWMYGDVVPDYNKQSPINCSYINKQFTFIAYVLIWLQPLLFSLIGFTQLKSRSLLKLVLLNSCLFLYALSNLYYSAFSKPLYEINDSMFGQEICTDTGLSHHLSWRFPAYSVDLHPNHATYLFMCISSFIFFKNELKNIGLGWGVALLSTKLILAPFSTEIASAWCMLSIIANFIILFRAKYN